MTSCKGTLAKPQQNVRRISETPVTGACGRLLTIELMQSQSTVPVLSQHGHSLPGDWFDHFDCLSNRTETPLCIVMPLHYPIQVHPHHPLQKITTMVKPWTPGSLDKTAKPWGHSSRPLQARGLKPPLQEWRHSPEMLGHLCPISTSSL